LIKPGLDGLVNCFRAPMMAGPADPSGRTGKPAEEDATLFRSATGSPMVDTRERPERRPVRASRPLPTGTAAKDHARDERILELTNGPRTVGQLRCVASAQILTAVEADNPDGKLDQRSPNPLT
jgi:hypothetical protein